MIFQLTILGSNSAMPAHGRHLSAQVLEAGGETFLIDCGEGTQMRMDDLDVKKSKINHIFISHLHGDHIFGLIGLLMTYGLKGRRNPLHIYSPEPIEPLLTMQMEKEPLYAIFFHVSDSTKSELLFENEKIEVRSIPLVHRIPCHGFLFVEKERPANIIKEKIKEHNIPYQEINAIKRGANYTRKDGILVSHSELTTPAARPRSFAYCSDTMYSEAIIPIIQRVNLLYHESTFLHDLLAQAEKTKHSTALQAAKIAQKANVGQLILGHFSSRYADLTAFINEAKTVFDNTLLAKEGEPVIVKEA